MKTQKCNFTSDNIRISVISDGRVLLGNVDTKKVYDVVLVKEHKVKMPKHVKRVKIKVFCEGVQEYKK